MNLANLRYINECMTIDEWADAMETLEIVQSWQAASSANARLESERASR